MQTFVMVAETGSFRLAAAKLHKSHSAISSQIRQLEEQMDVRLFDRTTRSVQLTPEGKLLRESANRAVYEMQMGMRLIKEAADKRRGQVSIASSSSLASSFLPPILTKFVYEFPDISVTVRELTSADLFKAMENKEVDFAIGPIVDNVTLNFEVILVEHLNAIIPKPLWHTDRESITLSELAAMPVLLSTSATAMRHLVDSVVQSHHLILNNQYQFMQAQTLIAMAEAGLGVAILPQSSIQGHLCRNAGIYKITEPEIWRKMGIITRREGFLSPAASSFAEMIKGSSEVGNR
ncbi:LysR family transcriptional regulator [Pelagibacterium lacus]|uniref:LysR family transcriptional regulator n=2 Tax=Pelagibacterium lacus TaxID=2282655 RepID=A0A369W161_9HYPH|nr:LysR family transcriptional regulator [Pelagibacterium lacus]